MKDKFWWVRPWNKKNVRFRCNDCGAQFWSATEETKLWMHSFRMHHPLGLHTAFTAATATRRGVQFTIVSDALTYTRKMINGEE